MVDELRGNPSLSLELVTPLKKSICCSRSFSAEVFTLAEITESIIHHLSTAAEKMRKQKLVTNAIQLFIHTNLFKEKGLYSNGATVKFNPTESTRELISAAMRILHAIYRPGYGYRKSGVVLLGLQPRAMETRRLFDDDRYQRDRELMVAIDTLNAKHGRRTVSFGLFVNYESNWQMSRNHLSRSYTTAIGDILRVSL